MPSDFLYSTNVLELIYKGIEICNNLVKHTLGPNGSNVLISQNNQLKIVDDGYTVVKNIKSSDIYESIGINFCQSIITSINDLVGDGTTSSIILFSSLIKKVIEKINEGFSSSSIVKALQESQRRLLKEIDFFSKKINIDDLINVLKSTTTNKEIIYNVFEAFKLVGTDGKIILKESLKDYIVYSKGYFIDIKNQLNETLENYQVLLINDYMSEINDFKDILKSDRKILFIVKDASKELVNFFKIYKEQKGLSRLVLLNHPNIEVNQIFSDLSCLLNVKLCLKELISTSYLSSEVDCIINKNQLIFNIQNDELTNEIKKELSLTKSLVNKKLLENRLAKLTNGFVTIYISGTTEEELHNKFLKYEDAIKTGYHALKEGVVYGGGYIYYALSKKLDNIYINILEDVLKQIIVQLVQNNNDHIENIFLNINDDNWYDAEYKKVVSLDEYHIYDATKTIKEILKVIINNACLLINTRSIIIDSDIKDMTIDNLI